MFCSFDNLTSNDSGNNKILKRTKNVSTIFLKKRKIESNGAKQLL